MGHPVFFPSIFLINLKTLELINKFLMYLLVDIVLCPTFVSSLFNVS